MRDSVRALFRLRAAEPALRDGPLTVLGATGAALALERGSGASRFVVVANPGATAVRLPLRFTDAPAGHGGHLAPIALPGLGGVAETVILDGEATLDVEPLAASILRVV